MNTRFLAGSALAVTLFAAPIAAEAQPVMTCRQYDAMRASGYDADLTTFTRSLWFSIDNAMASQGWPLLHYPDDPGILLDGLSKACRGRPDVALVKRLVDFMMVVQKIVMLQSHQATQPTQ